MLTRATIRVKTPPQCSKATSSDLDSKKLVKRVKTPPSLDQTDKISSEFTGNYMKKTDTEESSCGIRSQMPSKKLMKEKSKLLRRSKETFRSSVNLTRSKIEENCQNIDKEDNDKIPKDDQSSEEESEKRLNPRFHHFRKYSNLRKSNKKFDSESGIGDEELLGDLLSIDNRLEGKESKKVIREKIKIPIENLGKLNVKKNKKSKSRGKKTRRELLRSKRFERNMNSFNKAWNKLELKDAVYLKMLKFKPGKIVKGFKRSRERYLAKKQEENFKKIKSFEIKRRKKRSSKSPTRGHSKLASSSLCKSRWNISSLPGPIKEKAAKFDDMRLRRSIERQNFAQTNFQMHKSLRFGRSYEYKNYHKFKPGRPVFLVRKVPSLSKRNHTSEKKSRKHKRISKTAKKKTNIFANYYNTNLRNKMVTSLLEVPDNFVLIIF